MKFLVLALIILSTFTPVTIAERGGGRSPETCNECVKHN
jgi:hypothetical protein